MQVKGLRTSLLDRRAAQQTNESMTMSAMQLLMLKLSATRKDGSELLPTAVQLAASTKVKLTTVASGGHPVAAPSKHARASGFSVVVGARGGHSALETRYPNEDPPPVGRQLLLQVPRANPAAGQPRGTF